MVKNWFKYLLIGSILFLTFLAILGSTVDFDTTYAQIIYDKNGRVLNGHVAEDEQWRIQCADVMPKKLATCLVLFEDNHFYLHPGVNPISLIKSLIQNFRAGRIVRGGSTLTMQVVRLSAGKQK